MMDFIHSIDFEKDNKSEEIYELFKTESSDLNLEFLSNVKKHKELNDFISYYSKQDFKNVLKIFDGLNTIVLNMSNLNNNKIDDYLSDISLIIIKFSIIEKTIKLLNNYINNAKDTLAQFDKKHKNNTNQKKLNNCLDELINNSLILISEKYSRRSTKERTLSSVDILQGKRNSILSNMTTDESDIIISENRTDTPKFQEKELSKRSNGTEKKEINSHKTSEKTIDSILSLKNMKFLYDSGDKNLRAIRKKNKTIKIGFEKQETINFFKQKSNSNKINENNNINNTIEYNPECIDKSQILADLLNSINCLFKNGKIDSKQKLYLKQLLVADSEKLINRFFKFNQTCIPFNTNLKCLYKNFLISELKNI